MSDYYPNKAARAGVDPVTYNRVLWTVRGYEDMVDKLKDLIDQSGELDGQPKSRDPGDPVAAAAMRREALAAEVKIIEDAKAVVPGYYREVVYKWVAGEKTKDPKTGRVKWRRMTLKDFPASYIGAADVSTWTYWRVVFIKYIANKKGWL